MAERALSLGGRLLVASPGMQDPNFRETVVVMVHHDAEGAMGLVVNRPHPSLTVARLLDDLGIEPREEARPALETPVFHGGPVEPARGFVLHEARMSFAATMPVTEELAITASRDALEAMAAEPPARFLVAVGYAGWAAMQLEGELGEDAWIVAPMDAALVFELPPERRWRAALASVGIDPAGWIREGGHA